jgi:mannose-6-phosphate isomerase class I
MLKGIDPDSRKEITLYSFFETAFAEYENKINKMVRALEDEANYLQQLIEKLNKISDEWQTIEDSLLHFRKYGAGTPCIYPAEQNHAIEKELEELILCIVNEVNNNNLSKTSLN